MKIIQLLILDLLLWCQAAQSLIDQLTDLGQNVTINCTLDEGGIYWLLLKLPDPPVMILRTTQTNFFCFNKTFRHKYSVQSHRHLFINNVTTDELGDYYCMKKDTVPPEFSDGTRLHIIEPTQPTELTESQTHTVVQNIVQSQTQWHIIILISALLNGVLIIVVTGCLSCYSGKSVKLQGTQLQTTFIAVEQSQELSKLQYTEVDFSILCEEFGQR
ncbi:uncharacterized protein LOC127438204 [Myxocyprinus asiaticus]|uniref:uncharacterized protein LOC127438204 n=1 Tax=Myxocyprinus asiaticus TaxID=70543 RepID=UPI0022223D64|nr:uncharacterized protein LOC127438204 [Myxocyprinus asiaticus]